MSAAFALLSPVSGPMDGTTLVSSPFECNAGDLSERNAFGSTFPDDEQWMASKLPRGQAEAMKAAPFLLGSASVASSGANTLMLSFASTENDGHTPQGYSYFTNPSSAAATTILSCPKIGGKNEDMHASGTRGMRGPFTPSQWMELENQALIYKYLAADAPVPSSLLIPIRRTLCYPNFSSIGGFFRSNAAGWSLFHLGHSGSADPEPGRCRRTDGKKWRCSRDAVADQKYCERHMNRGRHRSRKHVEGHPGHAAKMMPTSAANAPSAAGRQSAKNLTTNISGTSVKPFDRVPKSKDIMNFDLGSEDLSMLTNPISKLNDGLHDPFDSSSKCSSEINFLLSDHRNSAPSPPAVQEFVSKWPHNHADDQTLPWTKMGDNVDSSALRSQQYELYPLPAAFGDAAACRDVTPGEEIMDGPLGEVLAKNRNRMNWSKNLLLTDAGELQLQTSPTGVLQKTTFGSVF